MYLYNYFMAYSNFHTNPYISKKDIFMLKSLNDIPAV
jgi:hypothetical protein